MDDKTIFVTPRKVSLNSDLGPELLAPELAREITKDGSINASSTTTVGLDVQPQCKSKLLILKHCDESKNPPLFSMFKDKNQLSVNMDAQSADWESSQNPSAHNTGSPK